MVFEKGIIKTFYSLKLSSQLNTENIETLWHTFKMDHLIVAQFIWNCYINILILCDAGLLLVYKVLNDRILFLLLYDLEEASLHLV